MTITLSSPVLAPSSHLPPIRRIKLTCLAELSRSLAYLRLLYNPEVRGIRCISRTKVFPVDASGNSNEFAARHDMRIPPVKTHSDTELDVIRGDEFERAYAIRWLTSLVSQGDRLSLESTTNDPDEPPSDPTGTNFAGPWQPSGWDAIVQEAAALLAVCAGTASAGTVSRTFVFRRLDSDPSPPAHADLKVQVTDVPLENNDYSSVGAQTWGSACLLAEMMVQSPEDFGLTGKAPHETLRVLELGAGTGLVSIVAAKLLQDDTVSSSETAAGRTAAVTATDFHPSVLANLQDNIDTNFGGASPSLQSVASSVSIQAQFLDWSALATLESEQPHCSDALPDGPYDVILGADIIYEPEHAKWIKGCLQKLLRKPTNDTTQLDSPSAPRFHLVIPLRHTHVREAQTVEEVFPLAHRHASDDSACLSLSRSSSSAGGPAPQPTLAIVSKEVLSCQTGSLSVRSGSRDEIEYIHYIIAWVTGY